MTQELIRLPSCATKEMRSELKKLAIESNLTLRDYLMFVLQTSIDSKLIKKNES